MKKKGIKLMNPRRSKWDIETKEYEYDGFIKSTAEKYGLDYTKFRQQLYQESRFNPNAVSKAGAIGIGQIMPATAKAYGYKDISKLRDPYLNIDLAGQIMKDNLKYSKGNLYGAMAMYNGGTKAMKKYLEGNFKDMPKETWDYLDILGDGDQWGGKKYEETANSPQKSFVDTPPEIPELKVPEPVSNPPEEEITPFTQDPVNEDAVRGAHLSTTLSTELGLRFRSRCWADPSGYYNPAEDEANEPSVGFFGGVANNWVAMNLKMGFSDEELFGSQYMPTKEEGDYVLKKVGYNMDRYFAVLNGASSMKDIEERIKITDEHLKYLQAEAKAGMFSSILSGVGSSVADPITYLTLGGYGLAGRVLIGAVSGAVSNQLDTYYSGAEHDIVTDMLIGAGLGLGAEFGLKALGKGGHYVGNAARKAYIIREYELAGKELPSEMIEGYGWMTKGAKATLDVLDKIEKRFPAATVKGLFKRLESKDFREFTESFFVDRGAGYVDEKGVHYATRYQGITAEERIREARIDFDNFEFGYRDHFNNLRKLGHQSDEINLAICQALENDRIPQKFINNEEFTSIVESAKDFLQKTSKTGQRGGYLPRVSDSIKVSELFDPNLPRGTQVEKLVNELSQSLVDGVTSNPKVKQRIIDYYKKNVYAAKKAEREAQVKSQQKKYSKYKPKNVQILKALPDEPEWSEVFEWMKKEARDDALGWIDQGASMGRNIINDSNISSVNYNPEVTRIPWDTSFASPNGLSIDKLRRDPLESIRMHQNKVVGEGIIQSYGCNTLDEFKEKLNKMWSEELNTSVGTRVSADDFATARDLIIDMIYGKYGSRADINSSWLGAVADLLRNLTFFTKNAMMGIANLFEQAEVWKHYGAEQMFKGVPLARNMLDNWTNNGMTHEEVKQAQSFIFGLSVRDTGIFRDIATESWDRQLRRFNGGKGKAILVASTDILAQASPFTKFLQNSENSIVEASQGMFLGELIHYAHSGSKHLDKGFLNAELMKRNGISKENYENLLKILKESTEIDENGAIKITNLDTILSKDPMSLATLRRMGDYVAHEVIQKNTLGDTFLWEGSKKNPLLQLLLQFKTFAIRSYDKRFKKMIGRAAEGDALGQAHSLFLAQTLGTLGSIVNTYINTIGMTDEQRKEYLKKTLNYDPDKGITIDTIMQANLNGGMRNNILASVSLLLNPLIGYSNVKTTTEGFDYHKPGEDLYQGFDLNKKFRDYVPAYSTLKSLSDIAGFGIDVFKMNVGSGVDSNGFEYTEEQKEKRRESLYKSIRNATNIPYLKWGLYNMLSNEQ